MVDYRDLKSNDVQREDIRAVLESFYNVVHLTVTYEQVDERNFDSKVIVLESLSAFITELLKQKGTLAREDRFKLIAFLDKINVLKDAILWHIMTDSDKKGILKAANRMDKKAQSASGPVQ